MVRAPYGFSHEQLRRADPMYDLVILTGWNWPRAETRAWLLRFSFTNGAGRDGPTAGCIGLDRGDLRPDCSGHPPRNTVDRCRTIWQTASHGAQDQGLCNVSRHLFAHPRNGLNKVNPSVTSSAVNSRITRPLNMATIRSDTRSTSGIFRTDNDDGVALRRQFTDQVVDFRFRTQRRYRAWVRPTISTSGRMDSHLPITIFCWLPPDRLPHQLPPTPVCECPACHDTGRKIAISAPSLTNGPCCQVIDLRQGHVVAAIHAQNKAPDPYGPLAPKRNTVAHGVDRGSESAPLAR